VTKLPGGHGAVREVCDYLLAHPGLAHPGLAHPGMAHDGRAGHPRKAGAR
jgi:hypothetical protein